MILQAKNSCFTYPGNATSALKGIHLQIDEPGIYGIAGKTGSGKSTLLSAIAGKIDLSKGILKVWGEPVEGPSRRLLPDTEKVKLVAQYPDLWYDLSPEENLHRHLLFYQTDYRKKKSDYLLKKAGLFAKRHVKTEELSGGQKQLLGILCAIAEEPQLLLLDEPFSNLDFATKENILDHLHEIINDLQLTTIFVSHDPIDLLGFCDYVFIMKNGKITEEGSPEDLFFYPEEEYSASLFGEYSVWTRGSNKLFLRPTRLTPDPKGKISVHIISITFRGNYYEFKADNSKGERFCFHLNEAKYAVGDQVKLRVLST